jgi:cysteine synthase B
MKKYQTIEDTIGATPLVQLQRIPGAAGQPKGNVWVGLVEGNNPAGSVKDRAASAMIRTAEARGDIAPGDTLIEATSGNTGIALAMVAAVRGYKMILIMPDNLSVERRASMTAYGAELILTPADKGGMEYARDLATKMQAEGKGKVLDQFANEANPQAHVQTTGPELWEQTDGQITHFVSAMGTTGTIMGVASYLTSRNPKVQIIGAQPAEGAQIPGIRKWPEAYQPKIYHPDRVDAFELITQPEAEQMARRLAAEEGIFGGISSAGALVAAMRVAQRVENATIVFIVCDRGDRYLSTGVFN